MADDVTNGAISDVFKGFMGLGPAGLFCIVLMLALVAMYRYFVLDIRSRKAEFAEALGKSEGHLAKEREDHDKTRQALMRTLEETAEANAIYRTQVDQQRATFDTILRFLPGAPR